MSEFKGTKGKWVVNKYEDYRSLIGLRVKTDNENVFDTLLSGYIDEEQEANALLISKAPEMLEMLEELTSANPNHDGFQEKRLRAINLIKQATEL